MVRDPGSGKPRNLKAGFFGSLILNTDSDGDQTDVFPTRTRSSPDPPAALRPDGEGHRRRGSRRRCWARPRWPRRWSRAATRRPGALAGLPHLPPKAKRVIFLHQSGGRRSSRCSTTSRRWRSTRARRFPTRSATGSAWRRRWGSRSLPVARSIFSFAQHGQSGTWVSELLPHTAKIVDDITVIKTMNTEAINHDPAITFIQTGFQQPGRPSMGAWLSYGLGSENQNLPAFVVLLSQAHAINADQPLFSRLWGSGFLPSSVSGRAVRRPAASRCSIWTIRRASTRRRAGRCSTPWRS